MNWEYRPTGRAGGGGWIEPFVFTDEEKKILLSAWGGETQQAARQKKAIGYLTKAENTIKDWKAMVYETHSLTGVEYRKQVQDYKTAVDGLSKAYNALHNEPYSGINMFTDEALFLSENKIKYKRLRPALAKIAPTDCSPNAGLNEVDEFIIDLLTVMSDGAERMLGNIEIPTGQNRSEERTLVRSLAKTYERHFHKRPSHFKGSNFVNFITSLAPMLSLTIGVDLIKSVIKSEGERKPPGQPEI